jgi:hypothetical protein
MVRLAAAVLCMLALAGSAMALPGRASAAPGLLVGVDDDTVKWLAKPFGLLGVNRDLGLDAVRVTIPWKRGRTKPNRLIGIYLHRVATMAGHGQRVVLAVYGRPADAPVDARGREQYCGFLRHVLRRIPVRDVVIWNEVNSPAYWPQQAGAPAYAALLGECWDALHQGLATGVNVISSTAAAHDPAGFVRDLGAAYRASERTRPLVDTFGHNPYPLHAAEPPSTEHDDPSVVGQGDLPELLDAFRDGFGGSPQPLPGVGGTRLWYLEDGFQTAVPAAKRHLYRGVENDRRVLPPTTDASGALGARRDQSRQLREALLLAYCQPAVGAFFNFELIDEDRLGGWQSGLLWRDGTRKPAYDAFKATVAAVKAGAVDCSRVPGAGGP